jgi:GTPase SAR1 family protein
MTVTTTSVTTSSIDELQTDEQRRILDTITEVRKQGLEGILSLPQIVVCGDQSAGKSSVLEALAEIPFPRNDNLCTRFATEISFRREPVARLTVKVIPHESRPAAQQDEIRGFSETITDFSELPRIMGKAMSVMGIAGDDSSSDSDDAGEDSGEDASDAGSGPHGAFSRDILSIEIEGPDRPQLTLVDIPGLIQSSTRGVTDADVAMVTEITDYYIQQPRTICLAVVSATNDAANQPILQRVRRFDPKGERTLGVITKPDRLPHGSGSEAKFLELARNEDVFFKLGWHVIKNRSFEESACSFADRNLSEMAYFRRSNFGALPAETVGIDALRTRLSHVLFEHVCRELPRLGEELDRALQTADDELRQMGESRATPAECRRYLVDLNMAHYDVCRAAVNGNYENPYFAMPVSSSSSKLKTAVPFSPQSKAAVARLRAMVQLLNHEFSEKFNKRGHKYAFHGNAKAEDAGEESDALAVGTVGKPIWLSEADALEWVRQALLRNRGKELMGNYNPLLVGELFWEQSEGWRQLAVEHIERMNVVCQQFLTDLLHDKTPADVRPRVWLVRGRGFSLSLFFETAC